MTSRMSGIVCLIVLVCFVVVDGAMQPYASIRSNPKNIEIINGMSGILYCSVAGLRAGYTVRWKFNSTLLYPETDPKYEAIVNQGRGLYDLKIYSANASDEGEYRCSIYGSGGQMLDESEPGTLSILPLPTPSFGEQPDNVTTLEGETAVFRCHVNNFTSDKLVVRWTKGDRIISNGHHMSYRDLPEQEGDLHHYSVLGSVVSGKFDLRITNLSTGDQDDFYCILYQSVGGGVVMSSRRASLTVLRHSCETDGDPRPFYETGDILTATCSVGGNKSSDTELSLSWLTNLGDFNGSHMYPDTDRHVIRDTWALSAIDDEIVISCVISSPLETLNQKKCRLGPFRVYFPPILSIFPMSVEAYVGGSITLDCSAHANPSVTRYRWLIDKKPVSASGMCYHISHGGRRITVKNLHEGNDGMAISCSARNSYSNGSLMRKVTVKKLISNDSSTTIQTHLPSTFPRISTPVLTSVLKTESSPGSVPLADPFLDLKKTSILLVILPSVLVFLLILTLIGAIINRNRRLRKWTPESFVDGFNSCQLQSFNSLPNMHRNENIYEGRINGDINFNDFGIGDDTNTATARSSPLTLKDSRSSLLSDRKSSVANEDDGKDNHGIASDTERSPQTDEESNMANISGNKNTQNDVSEVQPDKVSLTSFDLSLRTEPYEVKKEDEATEDRRRKNVEGLVYAELDLARKGNSDPIKRSESSVEYAELQPNNVKR